MRKLLTLSFCLLFFVTQGQTPQKLNSAEIYQAIKKLNFLGSVLYVAAHPDDENTRLISWFANDIHARTGYLSITRGDGGQNLIGAELQELLGVIRTQELLEARRIDGGEQMFTRAIDFGYTKTPEEAMEFWNSKEVLGDVVWAIRKFKPDVVINRFNHRTSGDTHGQHTASALLSTEAFELAGNQTSFPDQLKLTTTFSPKRLFFNTSPWFYGSEEEFKKAVKTNYLEFDTGVYFPLLGLSNPEIAALSRSQHQSQGFGSTGSRGSQPEYLELIKGELPADAKSVFAGIDTSWNRLKGGKEIGKILLEVEKNFDFQKPAASLPGLVKAYSLIQKLEDEHWKKIKSKEIQEIIAASAGLFLEATAQSQSAVPGKQITLELEAINRSPGKMELVTVEINPGEEKLSPAQSLENNEDWKGEINYTIPRDIQYTSPYWLKEKGTIGKYQVDDLSLVGKPENPPALTAYFNVIINGEVISFEKPVVYKFNDPVEGEVYQPFQVIPPVSVALVDKVLIFSNEEQKTVPVSILAGQANISGDIKLKASKDWQISPSSVPFNISEKGAGFTVNFTVTPPPGQNESDLIPEVTIEDETFGKEMVNLNYGHIPQQSILLPAKAKLVKLDIKKKGEKIAFIEGAGDVVPQSMEQIGYDVVRLDPAGISSQSLSGFDAVILGIRAYNTVDALKYVQNELFDYVKGGGTVVVQYNTNRGILVNPVAPYNLQISRDRVTEENAEVRFLTPEHPILNVPNKISSEDFKGWVQERGLYFADEWAPEFTPILSINDKNETPKEGALLVAPYGKGYFVYTGLSFFRQFPDGVPGAFRLFANIVSLGK